MSPWIVGKPVEYVTEKPPPCIHLKVVSDHARECHHPTFKARTEGTPKCLFIDVRLRDCAFYDSGDPNDKRALKVHEKKKPRDKEAA